MIGRRRRACVKTPTESSCPDSGFFNAGSNNSFRSSGVTIVLRAGQGRH